MKRYAITLLAFAASAVLALPPALEIKRANEIQGEPVFVPMKWTGLLSPDSTETTTLYGTVQDITAQILKLKPDYSPWDFEDFRNDMHAKGITRETYEAYKANRTAGAGVEVSANPSAVLKRDDPWYDCNAGGLDVIFDWCYEGLDYLRGLGGGNAQCEIDGRGVSYTCTRVSCSWDCGIHLCSRDGSKVRVACRDIAEDVNKISGACGQWFDIYWTLM
ncbi:hypothetical protein B0T16DRAFT_450384, partial [Cercophora newfieldiana]